MKTTPQSQQLRIELVSKLASIAKEKGITQADLEEKTGLLQNNISRIFNGKYSPSIDLIVVLAEALDYKLTLAPKDSGHEHNAI